MVTGDQIEKIIQNGTDCHLLQYFNILVKKLINLRIREIMNEEDEHQEYEDTQVFSKHHSFKSSKSSENNDAKAEEDEFNIYDELSDKEEKDLRKSVRDNRGGGYRDYKIAPEIMQAMHSIIDKTFHIDVEGKPSRITYHSNTMTNNPRRKSGSHHLRDSLRHSVPLTERCDIREVNSQIHTPNLSPDSMKKKLTFSTMVADKSLGPESRSHEMLFYPRDSDISLKIMESPINHYKDMQDTFSEVIERPVYKELCSSILLGNTTPVLTPRNARNNSASANLCFSPTSWTGTPLKTPIFEMQDIHTEEELIGSNGSHPNTLPSPARGADLVENHPDFTYNQKLFKRGLFYSNSRDISTRGYLSADTRVYDKLATPGSSQRVRSLKRENTYQPFA